MKAVDLYARVRRACHVDGMSQRQAARVFGIDPKTVAKMLRFSVPPGYRRSKPPARPKLDGFTGAIDRILEGDRGRPRKQRHTARRIFQRLRAEHGFAGGETIVKAYVRERRLQGREMFVPLVHPPGHGQADFGEAVAVVGGEEQRIHFFCLDLPHSDACFVKAYPAETTEALCDGHDAAFAFFGGVPRSMLYDNTRLAVARILGDGTRRRTRAFAELQSHFLFADRFGRPGKGNDKGKVEGLVGYARRNFLVPVPRAESFDVLNARLEPLHYLPLLERKIGALDQAGPLAGWELPELFLALRRLLETRLGKAGRREWVQVLRLLEVFRPEEVATGVGEALRLGAIGFDAGEHLVLCRIERRPPRLDLEVYPYLPRARVATTAARAYLDLLPERRP